ncbi:MAG: DUF1638 domain-containing protein [Deltaproteobacteria bacterium]|jgi:hypothetical protein|nr:DUF1638 domain-containing protein [Deltaproteobacteria bacterium]
MAQKIGVVACDVIKNEIINACKGVDIPMVFLDYGLHRTPQKMPECINESVHDLNNIGIDSVILGYGLCSNGVVGVSSIGNIIIPRCHDCISLLLGSPERYMKLFTELPGTYFLTDGWIRNGGDPISTIEQRYIPRLGEKKAWKGMRMELANYKKICFVNNGIGDIEMLRERSKENAKAFGFEYIEVEGDLSYFKRLMFGPREMREFVLLGPGEEIKDNFFYGNPELAAFQGAR